MNIFRIFKKPKREEKKKVLGKEDKPKEKPKIIPETKPEEEIKKKIDKEPIAEVAGKGRAPRSARRKESLIAWKVIKSPQITEKSSLSEKKRQYVFKVFKNANKTDIRRAIEEAYGVRVEKVSIINVPRKKRRRGRMEGWKKGYKKAIVKLEEGQKIEVLPR